MKRRILGIILACILVTIMVSSGHFTGAAYGDIENSSGNTFTGWSSTLWPQNPGTEFDSAVLENVEVSSESGEVRLTQSGGWYNPDWNYRKRITIDHTRVASDLTNFPVLIHLTSDADLASYSQPGGEDILFTASNAATKLHHEIEKYVSDTGELVAWVNVPVLSATEDTILYLYYGNAEAADQQDSSATWNSSFKAVWHLSETSGSRIYDSTADTNSGTQHNVVTNVSGIIDGGDNFNGTSAYTDLGTDSSLNFAANTAFTLEGWFKTSDSYGPLVSFRDSSSGGADIDICLGYDGAATAAGSLMALVRGDNGSSGYARITGTVVNNNAWHYFVLTRNTSGTIQLYCDGASLGTASGSETGLSITSNIRALATEMRWILDSFTTNDKTYLNAIMDEVRVSAVQLSASWITTSYNNQHSPTTFASAFESENRDALSTANLILFWDGAEDIPEGWTDISAAGQPFYNLFPRGAATYGGTGGAANHSHSISSISEDGATSAETNTRGTAVASSSHSHSFSNISISTESNLPSYRNLRVIRYDSGVPSKIPEGAIAMFVTIPDSDWTRYSSQDDYFIQGADVSELGSTGGSNTHSHTVSATVSAPSLTLKMSTSGSKKSVASSTHIHTINGLTDIADNCPPYITVMLAKADRTTGIPSGMIGMFDDTPDSTWNVLSNTGGDFDSRFIVGSTVYGNTGGSDTHSHTLTSSSPSATIQVKIGTNGSVASSTHTHIAIFDSQDTLPPYRDVIIAQAVAPSGSVYSGAGTLTSIVLDTGNSGTGWDALFWDSIVPDNTGISFEVRASDDDFDADDSSLKWSSIGDISPVFMDLPAGQYKQWRAVFTSDGTDTPVLNAVRLYYTVN